MFNKKILIFGIGFVGASLSFVLAKKHKVYVYDIDDKKVKKVMNGEMPVYDSYAEKLNISGHKIQASSKLNDYKELNADYAIISIPTDYNEELGDFKTTDLDTCIESISDLKIATVIKSTVPIGYTAKCKKSFRFNFNALTRIFKRRGAQ